MRSTSASSISRAARYSQASVTIGNMTERPPLGPADQRLKLHPEQQRPVEPHPDRPPAERGVLLLLRLEEGQDLVRADVEGAEHHLPPGRRVEHALVERRLRVAPGQGAADHELKLGAEEPDPLRARDAERGQIGQHPGIHAQAHGGPVAGLGGLGRQAAIDGAGLLVQRQLLAKGGQDRGLGAQMHPAEIAVHHDRVAGGGVAGDPLGLHHHRQGQRPRHDRGMAAERALLQHQRTDAAAMLHHLGRAEIARDEHRALGTSSRACGPTR